MDRSRFQPSKKKTREGLQRSEIAVVILQCHDRVFVQMRQEIGVLNGLWEFPGGKLKEGEEPRKAASRELWEETGVKLSPDSLLSLGKHEYRYPDRYLKIHSFLAELPEIPVQLGCGRWIRLDSLVDLPMPAANQAILDLLVK